MTLRHALAGCNFAAGLRIQVYVGPEGGFTEAEIAQARRYGVQPITLGPRILRAETAGVIAAALILYEAGEM
jgi:16S rRNA (uracil1498-N3)-methyltransferase